MSGRLDRPPLFEDFAGRIEKKRGTKESEYYLSIQFLFSHDGKFLAETAIIGNKWNPDAAGFLKVCVRIRVILGNSDNLNPE